MSMRVSINQIPNKPTMCAYALCVYIHDPRDGEFFGRCPDPRTGKQNSDSMCHRIGNAKFLAELKQNPALNEIILAPPVAPPIEEK